MKVRPLADRILVKREEASETVRGGLIKCRVPRWDAGHRITLRRNVNIVTWHRESLCLLNFLNRPHSPLRTIRGP